MLLTIDVGNTHTVLGVFNNDKLLKTSRVTSSAQLMADESWLTIKKFIQEAGILPTDVRGLGISSVVPHITGIFETIARKFLKIEPVTVSIALDLGIKVLYKDPSSVGADRLCNAIAGFKRHGGPLIVIDLGTATTYDVVSETGDFLGGVITLGMGSSAAELHRRAARLPEIELHFPQSIIAKDTVSAMQAGIMFGAVDALEGTVKRINAELGRKAKVIATGGLSSVIAKYTDIIEAYEPALVLEGIRLVVDRISGRN